MSDEPMRTKGDASQRAEHNRQEVICVYCGKRTRRYACPGCDLPAEPPSCRIMDGWIVGAHSRGSEDEKRLRWARAEIRRLWKAVERLEAHIRDSETGRIESALQAEVVGFIMERDEAIARGVELWKWASGVVEKLDEALTLAESAQASARLAIEQRDGAHEALERRCITCGDINREAADE